MLTQQAYVDSVKDWSIAAGSAFVRGMRDLGYKSSAEALDELIDNSYESGADVVHVILHDDSTARKNNVSQIAVIDNGCGMVPGMIRAAMRFGGTHRENSRVSIGRYGFGLKSAALSQGRRIEVYSQTEGGSLHGIALDLDDIESGKLNNEFGSVVVPQPHAAALPAFVQKYIEDNKNRWPKGKFDKGTVVVIDKCDRLSNRSEPALRTHFLEHFGVIYHKIQTDFSLVVNGVQVEPIDPLFLTPGFRYFDLDADRAKALDPLSIPIKNKDTQEVMGVVNVRYAIMPPTFLSIDKERKADKGNANSRAKVLKDYLGIIVTRANRVMGTISPPRKWTTLTNNDRYWKIEISFEPSLDEEFGVETTKQSVELSDRMWQILKEEGCGKAIDQMRKTVKDGLSKLTVERDTAKNKKRLSEEAAEAASKLLPLRPRAVQEKLDKRGSERLDQEAKKRAAETGIPFDKARVDIEAELKDQAYKVALRAVPGGNFFEVEQMGGTKLLWLNTSSRFFQEVHSGPDSTPQVRAALEILLFAIGDRVLDSQEELRKWYAHEIPEWSRKVEFALGVLAEKIAGASVEDAEDDDADQQTAA